jgi:hypothetical protein
MTNNYSDYNERCEAARMAASARYGEVLLLATEFEAEHWADLDCRYGSTAATAEQVAVTSAQRNEAAVRLDNMLGWGWADWLAFVAGGEHGLLAKGMAHATSPEEQGWEEERQFLINYIETACKVAEISALI